MFIGFEHAAGTPCKSLQFNSEIIQLCWQIITRAGHCQRVQELRIRTYIQSNSHILLPLPVLIWTSGCFDGDIACAEIIVMGLKWLRSYELSPAQYNQHCKNRLNSYLTSCQWPHAEWRD